MSEFGVAVLLGALEGLTEFLPISSTGHLILVGHWLGFTGELAKTFDIFIQLGAIFAIVVLYFRRFVGFLTVPDLRARRLNIVHLALGVLPAAVVGFLLHDFIKSRLFSPQTVVYGLFAGALLMAAAEWVARRGEATAGMPRGTEANADTRRRPGSAGPTARTVDELTYAQALWIGLFQTLALYPGFSRSGATISGGILAGASRAAAAEFSFLVAVPVMFGAVGLDLVKSWSIIRPEDWGVLFAGFGTAFVTAMLAVVTFLRLLGRYGLGPFVVYRLLLVAMLWGVLARRM
ncbi:undecaprenyl-diphosphate phosphatase [Hydrogenibacillus sp. N12]|uniref:undecaprenyl-diphosphate phosphatase n=1 Tax=Hydrogenibacillus sp. N12 TaxID=2866627 RepID=UPI001C7DD94B|nr:undecaprenyl-diphosphate phosphatase [Hydrogenibacillus sp. N12]QZA34296.1 undecaprenyl-diphosphate phosphatase [Hydrogenibacillus sp. N12]